MHCGKAGKSPLRYWPYLKFRSGSVHGYHFNFVKSFLHFISFSNGVFNILEVCCDQPDWWLIVYSSWTQALPAVLWQWVALTTTTWNTLKLCAHLTMKYLAWLSALHLFHKLISWLQVAGTTKLDAGKLKRMETPSHNCNSRYRIKIQRIWY